jgi:glycosyltransferase involved in cell wall biosynthesis
MPAVSVLVPCYNVEKYIRQCLDSVVGQTLTDLEIICLNDGSTDGTLAILQEYAAKDSRVSIIDKPNSGYGDSLNKGLEAATGEYVGLVESDDWADANMFESLYKAAKEHNADMVKSNFYD